MCPDGSLKSARSMLPAVGLRATAVLACIGLFVIVSRPTSLPAVGISSILITDDMQNPVFAASPPGDLERLFVVELKTGRIRIIRTLSGRIDDQPFLTIHDVDASSGERGLLGLAFHPDYQRNGHLFVNYTGPGGHTRVVRYTVSTGSRDEADPSSALLLLTLEQPFDTHNGGWLGFGSDGYLYVATGDGGSAFDPGNHAQTISRDLLGKILRLDVNGDDFPLDPDRNYAIPGDNPFVGVEGDDEIWSYGLRNPWRPSFDRATGDLWIADVGQGLWEEIDFQAAGIGGLNYGWRVMEGDHPTGLDGGVPPFERPVHEYSHDIGRSVTGGYVYRGGEIPGLEGAYFFADFITGKVWTLRHDGGAVTEIVDRTSFLSSSSGGPAWISSFAEDERGELYLLDYTGGRLFKIWPGATDLGKGWKELGWLGVYYDLHFPWIFHGEHGWLFWSAALHSDVWFFSPGMGWLWTSRTHYPYLYRAADGAWLYYVKGSNPRAFYNFTTFSWELH